MGPANSFGVTNLTTVAILPPAPGQRDVPRHGTTEVLTFSPTPEMLPPITSLVGKMSSVVTGLTLTMDKSKISGHSQSHRIADLFWLVWFGLNCLVF